ncbi:MAG TPA: glycosyltransferase family 9 protein [Burkholderiales bacterium]|nr:glycosyltransferase family 9 protein [Burkholderiales bacterium]
MDLPFSTPPARLCLLRLSALGDICHTLPIVRAIQRAWPRTELTWIVGRIEHGLVHDVPGIEFIVFDKSQGLGAYAELRRQLRGRRFDALLHMQVALRASLASLCVASPIRLGFDRARARDFQWLFTNCTIAARPHEHVMDGLFGFAEALGIRERRLAWEIPIPAQAHEFAQQTLGDAPALVISPSASASERNWNTQGYAALADYAEQRYGMHVVLTGGPGAGEREVAHAIVEQARGRPLDLVGRTTLKQLLAIFARAKVVVAPDSGPIHMATAVGVPVIGLYACSNPERTGPYVGRELTVNEYPAAALEKYGRPADALSWGIRVRDRNAMNRIRVEQVIAMLDKALKRAWCR